MNGDFKRLISCVILLSLAACTPNDVAPQQLPTLDLPPGSAAWPTYPAGDASQDLGWIKRGESAAWPAYLPSDIPPLEGRIRLLMEGGDRVRIFYQDMTKEQIEAYLQLLQQQGFNLQYQVYVQEGFPDNSAERMKKGDYDAVDIRKGVYHLNIAYGEGDITLDIDTSGFLEAIPTSAGLDWPAGLAGIIPKPERCPVESAEPDPVGGYNITCRPSDGAVAQDYQQALRGAGFLPKETPSYTGPGAMYGRDDLEILVEQTSTYLMHIRISQVDLSNSTWPSNLSGVLPEPEGCRVTNVLEGGGPYPLVSVRCEGGRTVQDYLALLVSGGFVETSRMEMPDGSLVSARLENGPVKVHFMISSSTEFMVQVST